MTISIILHPYGEEKPGGLARTIFEWTSGLLRNDRENEYLIFTKEKPRTQPVLPGRNWKLITLGGGRFWLDRLGRAPKADAYIFQTPVLPFFFRPKNAIIIAQDYPYQYLKPKSFSGRAMKAFLQWYHGRSLRRARAVIAVSESTKRDTMRFFGISENKIRVIYMGYKNICATPETPVILPEKFFLFVGVLKERKNVERVVRAFHAAKHNQRQIPHQLVFAGKTEGPYAERIKNLVRELGLKNDVVFLGYLNDSQLSYVYRRAEALLFPSIVESFGFPILEAMACGVPVITSNTFGPGELGKEAAILVDPLSIPAVKEAMEKVATEPAFRTQLVMKGRARAREFSWDKTAKGTLEFIEEIT